MKYYLDTEFIEDGKTIQLLSIGIVAEDGRKYYAESLEGQHELPRADPWVHKNVVPFLTGAVMLESNIRDGITAFIGEDQNPEFWGYYADYDWVVFCQLWGRMIDLPERYHKYCNDLKQLCMSMGNPLLPKQVGVTHNALADAEWNHFIHGWLLQRSAHEPQQFSVRKS